MIDLIIPYYNNPEGFTRTIDSINNDIFYITVVDDNSSIYMPTNLKVDKVYRYNRNRGPGYARQWGIEHTSNPYIMFIDTGDVFLSYEVQEEILRVIEKNPKLDFISFPYYHYGELTKATDNRLHGKIYKRSFLEKYKITFSDASPYLNEDIGFNRTCRLCTDITFIPTPVIEQIKDDNSLTNKDGEITLYRDQTLTLSLVSIHSIEICRKNNIDPTIEINQVAIALYYWFVRCAAEMPEYLQDAWSGAKIFYDYFKDEIRPGNLWIGSAAIKKCLTYKNKINFPINVLRFAHDIWENEIVENNYLTKV